MAQTFIKDVLKNDRLQGNWYLPICFRICGDLRLIAKAVSLIAQSEIFKQLMLFIYLRRIVKMRVATAHITAMPSSVTQQHMKYPRCTKNRPA